MWGAAMDVGGWLRSLGLGQYEANFRDNGIYAELLQRLKGDDLKELGVSALGHRLRLLNAIAAFVTAVPSTAAARVTQPPLASSRARPSRL